MAQGNVTLPRLFVLWKSKRTREKLTVLDIYSHALIKAFTLSEDQERRWNQDVGWAPCTWRVALSYLQLVALSQRGGFPKSQMENVFISVCSYCKASIMRIQMKEMPWLVWLSGSSIGLRTERSLVWFPVRAHTWVAGQVSGWGHARSSLLMFLSLSFSLPSPFSKIK